jgi:acyl-coenzyme A synthetase/AMP-(fatty) acid ligase
LVGTVPTQHSYGLETMMMLPLQGYCAVHSERPFFPQDIQQALAAIPPPRVLITTPVHLRALTEAGLPMPAVTAVWSATAPLSHALATRAEQLFNAPVHEIFGCTETGSCATRRTTRDQIWTLLDIFSLEVDSAASRNAGTLINAPHLPCSATLQDQIELIDAHHFRLLGRGADLINIAGRRASLNDLNLKLLSIEGVVDGILFLPDDTTPDSNTVLRTAALVVAPTRSREQVLSALRRLIDPAFLPRPLLLVDALPRNEVTKLPRAAVLKLLAELMHAQP